ncbi:MAG: exopolysaccharide biosynthesis polyprenyl glycosylphosphotransferase [Chloroflexota bacterium]
MQNSNRSKILYISGRMWLENILLITNDLLCIILSFILANLVRWVFQMHGNNNLFDPQVLRTFYLVVISSLIMLAFWQQYPGWGQLTVYEIKNISEAVFTTIFIDGAIIFLRGNNTEFSRPVFLFTTVISAVVISLGRLFTRKTISSFSWWGEPVIIIGNSSEIIQVSKKLFSCPRLGLRPVLGLCLDNESPANYSKIAIKPWSLDLQSTLQASDIKTNIIAIPASELKQDYPEVYHSIGVSFEKTIFVLDNENFSNMMAKIIDLNGRPSVVSTLTLLNPALRLTKTIFEILLILLFAIPILLIGIIITILIKLDSPGPIFYLQERTGENHKPFYLYKFRTMLNNADEMLNDLLSDPAAKEEWETYHKLNYDRRITRTGRFLRKFSLDELPQFINILRGEMNLIGPRPLVQAEIEKLGEAAAILLKVKPGLTGWWEVNGRNKLSFDQRVQLDLYYLFNWTIWLDLFIFIKTIYVVLFERNGK